MKIGERLHIQQPRPPKLAWIVTAKYNPHVHALSEEESE